LFLTLINLNSQYISHFFSLELMREKEKKEKDTPSSLAQYINYII